MVTARFDHLLRSLIVRWKTWQDAPRHPERVPQLARARFALEDARTAISAEREVAWGLVQTGALTSVSAEDRARLRVLAAGNQQN